MDSYGKSRGLRKLVSSYCMIHTFRTKVDCIINTFRYNREKFESDDFFLFNLDIITIGLIIFLF